MSEIKKLWHEALEYEDADETVSGMHPVEVLKKLDERETFKAALTKMRLILNQIDFGDI